jgi:hypothetical protein
MIIRRVSTNVHRCGAIFREHGEWTYLVPYVKAPSTSIAVTAADAIQLIHPRVLLANDPHTKCGYRTTPPETGNIVPSSA